MKKSLLAARTTALMPVGIEVAHFALTGSPGAWGTILACGFASFGLLGVVNIIFKEPKPPQPPQRFIAVLNGWQMEAGRAEDVSCLLRAMRKEQEGLDLTIHEAAVMACATEVKAKPVPEISTAVVDKRYMIEPRTLASFDILGSESAKKFHVNTVHNTGFSDDDIFEHRIKCELCASWAPGKATALGGERNAPVCMAMPRPLALRPKLSHDIADNVLIEPAHLAKSIDHKERVFMGDRFTPEEIREHAAKCETCASVVDLPDKDDQPILEDPVVNLGPLGATCPVCGSSGCAHPRVRYHNENDPPDYLTSTWDAAAWDAVLNQARAGVGLPPTVFAPEPEPWAPYTVADVHTAKALGPLPADCDQVRLPSGQLATQAVVAELARIPDEMLVMPQRLVIPPSTEKVTVRDSEGRRLDQAIREQQVRRAAVEALREKNLPIPDDLAEAAGGDAGPVHLIRPFRAGVECPRGHYGIHTFEPHPDAYGVMIRTCSDEECGATWTESSE